MAALTIELINQGGAIGIGDDVTQPFFSVTGQTILVKQESVQVFTHDSPAAARAEADLVDPTGFTIGTTSISWIAPPHFYLRESLLVLYVGGNGPVIDLLEETMGPQFAGAGASAIDPNSYADSEVQSYLTLMRELEHHLNSFTSGRAPAEFATESIITVASQLEEYMEFFETLEGAQRDYVFETYTDEFRQSAESVASAATAIQETGSNEVIAQALARMPAFAIASVTASGTGDPVIVPTGYISTLLTLDDLAGLVGEVELTIQYRDHREGAAKVDPAQFEHMDSFDSLSFDTADGFRGLTLTTIKFDSEGAAADHLELVTSEAPGLQDLSATIGDAAFYVEVNEGGIGSMVFFKKGVWVVMLHTARPDGASPLVDLAGVEVLARTVADRL